MKRLRIDLEHCYGIRKLEVEFDFELHGNVFSIYAPNGAMKTSFANTFLDLSQGKPSSDRIWKQNKTKRIIEDENGNELEPKGIFVIEPYNEEYRSDRISTLLANRALRDRYEAIHEGIDSKANDLIAELQPLTKLKPDIIKEEFATSITDDPKGFFRALVRVREEVEQGATTALSKVIYSHVFNPKVEDILAKPEFKDKVVDYIKKYDELVSRSTFFKKGVFTHNNATDVARNLKANRFFNVGHSVFLRIDGQKTEISDLKELEAAIQLEKDQILTDASLRAAFEEIDKLLNRNADLRIFRKCLEDNQVVLTELANPDKLRQKLWVEYLINSRNAYLELLSSFNKGREEIDKIIEEAKNQSTKWAEVINIFNERFSVPFVVNIGNQEDVILKSDTPSICFDFLEDPDDKNSMTSPIEENHLKGVLSNGEKRALYILNIIFEIEARKEANQNTLFVVDDIADSFDYKNKYAIIEYLKEIAEEKPIFQQIILSHNFDFYRTVSSRLDLKRESRILASKANDRICLEQEKYQKSPFSHWRKNLRNSNSMLIASIPFIRNMAEFSGDEDSYKELTSLLHLRPDTDQFTIKRLQELIKGILHNQKSLSLDSPERLVKELIYQEAERISKEREEKSALECKVVLSIAIRLKSEEFLIQKINDQNFWKKITSQQTIRLIDRFKNDFPNEEDSVKLFKQVNLMTPENIHLNSFMYEPILDLSAHHLKSLYLKVNSL